MIELTSYPSFAAGLLAGYLHATMLWRSSHRRSGWTPWLGSLRLGMVATVLVFAALYGQILAAAGGWVVCFITSAALYVCTDSKRAPLSGESNSTESKDAKCN